PLRPHAVPKNAVPHGASQCRPRECASTRCPVNWPPLVVLSDNRNGNLGWKDRTTPPASLLCAERPLTTASQPLRGNRANHFREAVGPAFHFPVPSNSKTSTPV